jgi:hypothetical protein
LSPAASPEVSQNHKRRVLLTNLPLSRKEIVDAYIYVVARYLDIHQKHIDMAEEGVDYNVIKFNELGKVEFVNPNLDVAYLLPGSLVCRRRADARHSGNPQGRMKGGAYALKTHLEQYSAVQWSDKKHISTGGQNDN